MRLIGLLSLLAVVPSAMHGAMDHWVVALGAIAGALVSIGVIHKKLLQPCWNLISDLVADLREMKMTIDTVPGQFDGVHEKLRQGEQRMEDIEELARQRKARLDDVAAQLQLIADADAQAIRTAIAAGAARHAAIQLPSEADQRLFFRE